MRRTLAFTAKAMDLRTRRKGPPERIKTETYRILRDTRLTRELKSQYQNSCQICGRSISLGDGEYSEAHHLRPLGKKHRGPDDCSNIIVLCPNHHVEFDYGAIAVDPDTLRVVYKANDQYNGKRITLNPGHDLSKDYLLYHLMNIFRKK